MSQVLWTKYFLEAQCYAVIRNTVYQENHSAILVEQNGKGSSSKRTRNFNIRFFFFTDRIGTGSLTVEQCGTKEILADIFTKPLQGAQFLKFINAVLNINEWSSPDCAANDHWSLLPNTDSCWVWVVTPKSEPTQCSITGQWRGNPSLANLVMGVF